MEKTSPSTTVNEGAKNPNGQRMTMKGAACGTPSTPMEMHSSKNIKVEPGTSLGHKRFDKD